MLPPVSQDIAAAFAAYFFGGSGPRHSELTSAFLAAGLGDVAPQNDLDSKAGPNKEQRVQRTILAAVRKPNAARPLIEALLSMLRVAGYFNSNHGSFDAAKNDVLKRALARQGWRLSAGGEVSPIGSIDLTTGGRAALDEQLGRLRQNVEDAGALLGTAKDLLESVAKFILEELGVPVNPKMSFDELWHHARDRLGILPNQVAQDVPGSAAIREILESGWRIARQVNVLRGLQGAGHGRTLPTGVTPEQAVLVVREACSIAEFALATLDRQLGRRAA